MSALAISFRQPVLPWSVSADDEKRFKRIVKRVLAVALLLALILPWIPSPKVERQAAALPPPLAKLLLERQTPPPPPPKPLVKEAEAPRPEAKNAEPPPKAAVPKEKQPPVPEARNPVAGKPPGEDAARKKASGVGLLAMKNEIAQMTGAPLAVQLNDNIKPGPGVGAGTGLIVGSAVGADNANQSVYGSQRQYDHAYIQCMYAKGHRVPVPAGMVMSPAPAASGNVPASVPPPPAGMPPPPPPR